MEVLAFTLLLIFILWLIDKHNLWRKALKVLIWTVAIGVVGLACLYGWSRYAQNRDREEAAARLKAQKQRVSDCKSRMKATSSTWDVFDEIAAEETCKANPDAPVSDFSSQRSKAVNDSSAKSGKNKTSRSEKQLIVVVPFVKLTTQEHGSLTSGEVTKGNVVILLVDDGYWVKVRSANGEVGWAAAEKFRVKD
jgi:hypothetical protein